MDEEREQAIIIIKFNGWGEREHAIIFDEEREQAIIMVEEKEQFTIMDEEREQAII